MAGATAGVTGVTGAAAGCAAASTTTGAGAGVAAITLSVWVNRPTKKPALAIAMMAKTLDVFLMLHSPFESSPSHTGEPRTNRTREGYSRATLALTFASKKHWRKLLKK